MELFWECELGELTDTHVPQLLAQPGCGPLTAVKLCGETANINRFRSAAMYAMHAGTAPTRASSGKVVRYRLARGGNRQLNAALYRIAVTQIRCPGRGQTYYQHRKTQGESTPKPSARSNAGSPTPSTNCSNSQPGIGATASRAPA